MANQDRTAPKPDREPGDADAATRGRIDPDRAADAAPGPSVPGEDLALRQDQLLDEALEETFPGSDPISPKQIT